MDELTQLRLFSFLLPSSSFFFYLSSSVFLSAEQYRLCVAGVGVTVSATEATEQRLKEAIARLTGDRR